MTTSISMIIQIELTGSEADLVVRWLEEKKPLTSHYVGTLAENIILKIHTAKRDAVMRA